ncbi:VOC family protein [bacterium]|nr:VOC family protein [bacterium]
MNLNQVTLPVDDIDAAKRFYTTLGLRLIVDAPHYLRFECPVGDATFSVMHDHAATSGGAVVYFEHPQLDDWVAELAAAGITIDQAPTDQRYLWREAIVHDPAGNTIKLYRAGDMRKHPPWRIEPES